MEFILNHFGYIVITLITGITIGWATFPYAKESVKFLKKNK